MTFCYLIMTHQNPAQIARLVRTILAGSADGWVLVLHDRRGCPLEGIEVLADPRVQVLVSPVAVHRGDFTMVAAYLHALQCLRSSERPWDWLIHLSGQCYPLRPLQQVEQQRARAPFDAYVHHWQVGGPDDRWRKHQGRIRYYYRFRPVARWAAPLLRAVKWTHSVQDNWRVFTTYAPWLGRRVASPPFGPELRLYGGSQWADLSRACVEHLLDFCERRPDVIEHFRGSAVPDESVVPTILANAGTFRISNDNRRYIDWRECVDGRPRTLTSGDLPAICASDCDFARKFDPRVDAAVLDALDARIASLAAAPDTFARGGERALA